MPAGSTYSTIATTTLGSAASSVTFSSISGSYTDLVIVSNVKITTSGFGLVIQFNSDTGTNYSLTNIEGNGTTANSGRATSASYITLTYGIGIPTASNTFSTVITNVMNYSNSTTNKTILSRHSNGSTSNSPGTEAIVGLWRNTAAITSITLKQQTGSNNLDAGSVFTLYGITAA